MVSTLLRNVAPLLTTLVGLRHRSVFTCSEHRFLTRTGDAVIIEGTHIPFDGQKGSTQP